MSSSDSHKEIEARFVDIDVPALKKKLLELGAKDHEEDLLEETIFYDKGLVWQTNEGRKIVRIRTTKQGTVVSYKHQAQDTVDSTEEIEFQVEDAATLETFLERVGLVAYRKQQKKRHTFTLGDATFDIDTWPSVPPPYVEIEGPSEESVKKAAVAVGLDWKNAIFEPAGPLIQRLYGIPVEKLHYFTFDRIE